MKKILSAGIVFPGFFLYGQSALHHPSAASPGLAAFSKEKVNLFSFQQHPAALARLKQTCFGIMHERPFLLGELSNYNMVAALTTIAGNFGLNASIVGFPFYHENKLGIAYARSLGEKADAGIQFNYEHLKVPGYGAVSSLLFEIGALFHITPYCTAGFHLYNPVHRHWNIRKEKPPSVYSLGVGYDASKKLFIGMQAEKEEDRPVSITAGFQYDVLPQLTFGMGVLSAVGEMYMMTGFNWRSSVIYCATAWHPQLGITPSLSLLVNVRKSK